jgi:biopolymer transport protein ExbD
MKTSIKLILLLVISLLAVLGGCKIQNTVLDKSKIPTADSPYAKVYVSKSGQVTLDGKIVTLDELDRGLAVLAQKHGVVLYSREAPQENEPHPIFKNVLDIVIKNKLPVRLCVNSDCSDALTADGKLRIQN